jgi:hypothetical protein
MTRPARQLLEIALHFVLAVAVSVAVVALMLALLPGEREATSRGRSASACGPSSPAPCGATVGHPSDDSQSMRRPPLPAVVTAVAAGRRR